MGNIRYYIGAGLIALLVVWFGVGLPQPAYANGTVYYVDSASGNDSNSGTGTSSAWQSLAKVNSQTFQPGDQILFKAGGSWTGTLEPKGNGDSTGQITISKYGTGNKPHIEGNGAEQTVYLTNAEYWTISNLDISNNASNLAKRSGIVITTTSTGIARKIYVQDNDIHDIDGDYRRNVAMYSNQAISICYPGNTTATNHMDDVRIEGNYIHDIKVIGIAVGQTNGIPNSSPYNTNVLIQNNTIARTGADGMIIGHTTNAIIQYNQVLDAGANGTYNDTVLIAGIWSTASIDPVWQYNEVGRTRLFQGDGTAFDTDWGAAGTHTFQYNYTHENQGGFFLNCIKCATATPLPVFNKTILRYNVSVNDVGAMLHFSDENLGIELYNNTFYKSSGNLTVNNRSNPVNSAVKIYNNIFNFQTSPTDWGNADVNSNLYYPIPKYAGDTRGISANPKFVNPGAAGDGMSYAANYKLQPSSPAIDNGINIANNGGQDLWGNPVGYNGFIDIGAHESQSPNSVQNGSFDAAAPTQTPQGWSEWNDVNASSSSTSGPNPGLGSTAKLAHNNGGAAFKVSTFQDLYVQNGTYKVSFYTSRSANANSSLVLKGWGGSDTYVATQNNGSWHKESYTVKVTTGYLQVGFYTDTGANTGQWADFDDVSVTRTLDPLNASFDVGAPTQAPQGWSEWNDVTASSTSTSGPNPGLGSTAKLYHYNAGAAFKVSTFQDIYLPNGVYTISYYTSRTANANSSLVLKGWGGSDKYVTTQNNSSWHKESYTVNVTTGYLQIAFLTDTGANTGQWAAFDDVSIARTLEAQNNGSFDAGAPTQTPQGWSEWNDVNASSTSTSGPNSGLGSTAKLAHNNGGAAFKVSTFQDIALPNGSYTVSFYTKRTANVSTSLVLKGWGGSDIYAATQNNSAWHKESYTVTVSTGYLQIGLYSDTGTNTGQWADFDDLTVTQN
ncbi:right-handed parallel beta-helix repeat-containing protein [Paenibacillus sacheonensis]|uniref:Uncharacterized protein n=1 Tax=Paenibacillus sacheonensis TaxID=742054 RepID=A0A7X4YWT9_9BACL|nr:right-handed parallel beta-helix repeat-containing protein [Paenibacillus sacheonensis]MBM7569201.1 hypothetical protein [Paenibacillus sacheonensis]NBC73026.1 hypothetical protein [Paenibacillus sacheonensis]